MKLLINSLLFQVHAVETLSKNKKSQIPENNSQILTRVSITKIKLLSKLKHFKNWKPLPFTKIYISTINNEKQTITISSIIDRLIQQLFVLVLNPFIESNSDPHSYGFRKGRNQIMVIGAIQKNIQNELKKNNQNKNLIFIWDANVLKCFDSINHKWILKHLPFSFNYKYFLKNWLKLGLIELKSNKIYKNFKSMLQDGIINLY